MRKIKEVLRLSFLGLAQRQIARSCSISQSTVSAYLKAAESAHIQWPDIAEWEESRLLTTLLPKVPVEPNQRRRAEPDFAAMHSELQQHKHLTLQLLWEEYRAQAQGMPYSRSRFCERYIEFRQPLRRSMRQTHVGGEKLFVDYAGPTVPIIDPGSGEISVTVSPWWSAMKRVPPLADSRRPPRNHWSGRRANPFETTVAPDTEATVT